MKPQSFSRGGPAADAVSVDLEVPFHDVDGLRIVWHGHYLKYLEIGRTALMRDRGLDWEQIAGLGYGLLVAETLVRHTFPLRYGEAFRVTTWCVDLDHRVKLAFEVWNLTQGRRAARGHATLVTTDAAGGLLYETPAEIRRRFEGGGIHDGD